MMNQHKTAPSVRLAIISVLGLIAFVPGLFGTPVCVQDTLAAYEAQSGGCLLGNYTLLDFTFSSSGTGGATLLNPTQISVDPTGSTPNNLSVHFSATDGNFSVNTGQTAEYIFHFTIDPILPTIAGPDMDLGDNDPVTLTGEFCGNGTLASAPLAIPVTCTGSSPDGIFPARLQIVGATGLHSASSLFPLLVTSMDTRLILDLNGANGPSFAGSLGGQASISPVPEPSTGLMLIPALAALAWLRKKRPAKAL